MDIVDLGPAAQQLSDLLARTGDDLGRPTPCPAYSLGDLIEHIGGMALAFTAAARKDAGPHTEQQPSGAAARLPADWRTRIPPDLAGLAQAWREPDAWAGMTRIAGMDAPGAMVGQTVAGELADAVDCDLLGFQPPGRHLGEGMRVGHARVPMALSGASWPGHRRTVSIRAHTRPCWTLAPLPVNIPLRAACR